MSLVRVDTQHRRLTEPVVGEAWRKAERVSGQWRYCFEATEVWDVLGHLPVRPLAPEAYELRGKKRGMLLSPVGSAEREALLRLEVRRVELPKNRGF